MGNFTHQPTWLDMGSLETLKNWWFKQPGLKLHLDFPIKTNPWESSNGTVMTHHFPSMSADPLGARDWLFTELTYCWGTKQRGVDERCNEHRFYLQIIATISCSYKCICVCGCIYLYGPMFWYILHVCEYVLTCFSFRNTGSLMIFLYSCCLTYNHMHSRECERYKLDEPQGCRHEDCGAISLEGQRKHSCFLLVRMNDSRIHFLGLSGMLLPTRWVPQL